MKVRQSWLSWPVARWLRCWQLRRLTPMRRGRIRGTLVVRYYWADFLERHRGDVRGRCLEIGDTSTIRRYGGDRVTSAEALDLSAHGPEVTVVADLSRADEVPADQFDCFLNQFTMTVVYDVEAALYHAIRILKPGGVLLINFGCVDFLFDRGLDMGTGEPLHMTHWFTPLEVENIWRRLGLGPGDVTTTVYGNLLTRMAFLLNMPAEELTPAERDHVDPCQPLLICCRVRKPEGWSAERPVYRDLLWKPDGEPYHMRPDTGHYGEAYL